MCAFLKSVDNKAWKAIINGGLFPPTKTLKDCMVVSFKGEKDWDDAALGNSRVVNTIYNGVDKNILRLINTYVRATRRHGISSKFLMMIHVKSVT